MYLNMESSKKTQKLELHRKTHLFFQIGLLITMALVVAAFEWKTEENEGPVIESKMLHSDLLDYIPITDIEEPEPPKPKPQIQPPKMSINIVASYDIEKIIENIEPATEEVPGLPENYLPEPDIEEADVVRDYVDMMPEPVIGMDGWNRFLGKNIRYPSSARSIGN